MAITSNVTINEGQVIFKRTSGHTHDGLLSSLIDTKKYSMFDFVPAPLSSDPTRVAFQENNRNIFKSFIVSTIEERVLNPKGIRIQANAITANEIATATITANELVRDFIMVNNTMRSNTFNGTVDKNGNITYEGGTGWAISHTGKTVFNDVSIRGTVVATNGYIGGININSNEIQSNGFSSGSSGFRISSNGNSEFNNITVRGTLYSSSGSIGAYTLTDSLEADNTVYDGVSLFHNYRLTLKDDATITARLIYDYNSSGDTHYPSGYTTNVLINQGSVIDGASIIVNSSNGGNTYIRPGFISVNNSISGPMIPTLAAASATHIGVNGGYISYVTSRREHKYDIQDITDLDIMDKFNTRIFKWRKTGWGEESEIEKEARESQYAIGFIVEELEEIENGRFVTYEDQERQKPLYWKIDNFIAMLVAEVQDLRKRVKILENGV